MKINSCLVCIILVCFMIIATTGEALAYIDPGSGSLVVQLLLAAVAGGLFYFRRFFTLLISFVRRDKKREIDKPNE